MDADATAPATQGPVNGTGATHPGEALPCCLHDASRDAEDLLRRRWSSVRCDGHEQTASGEVGRRDRHPVGHEGSVRKVHTGAHRCRVPDCLLHDREVERARAMGAERAWLRRWSSEDVGDGEGMAAPQRRKHDDLAQADGQHTSDCGEGTDRSRGQATFGQRDVRRPVAGRDLATADERGERCALAAQACRHGQSCGEGERANDAGNTDEAEQRTIKAM